MLNLQAIMQAVQGNTSAAPMPVPVPAQAPLPTGIPSLPSHVYGGPSSDPRTMMMGGGNAPAPVPTPAPTPVPSQPTNGNAAPGANANSILQLLQSAQHSQNQQSK